MINEPVLAIENLKSEASKLKIELTDEQAQQLSVYAQLIIDYNQHTNLVGNASPDCLLRDHILDSLALLPFIERLSPKKKTDSLRLIDLGSGAGFPGLVLAIAKTSLKITTVDATKKKVVFMERVIKALNLDKQTTIINGRAEELAHHKHFRASFDYATCRALGALPVVCELALPFLKPGGYALAQRGNKQIELEKISAASLASKFNASLVDTVLLDSSVLNKEHYVLLLKQNKPVSSRYPRSWKEIIG